jgi:hypothetical protein
MLRVPNRVRDCVWLGIPQATAEIRGFVLTSVLTQRIFRCFLSRFTYENRRGRESNPRIAVLQTATLPLGYPAICARNERNVGAQRVNAAEHFVATVVIRNQRRAEYDRALETNSALDVGRCALDVLTKE